ncbi:MAG: DUF72 domain-containing protein [Rhodospirillales bacterium]|nr:DUF72 domain-containing protein [Rhodospirillales bacterium]
MKKARPKGRLFIGTSGWSYGWDGFYPAGLPGRERLAFYASRFASAEVNYSFYHLPKESTFAKWDGETPDGFVFALKLSRFVTHIKRLKGVGTPLRTFLGRAKALGKKLGPILVQLPPSFRLDPKRLAAFLAAAARAETALGLKGLRFAFEFRHPTWFAAGQPRDAALALLEDRGWALAFAHSARYPCSADEPVTADFVYLRFHGPRELFASRYGPVGLKPWAKKIRRWRSRGLDVYAYFNNDVAG